MVDGLEEHELLLKIIQRRCKGQDLWIRQMGLAIHIAVQQLLTLPERDWAEDVIETMLLAMEASSARSDET